MLNFSPTPPAVPCANATGDAPTAIQVRRYLAARRKRDKSANSLFADPAWDILLDLFASSLEGRQVTVTGACIAAACPATTGLRYLRLMEDAGLIHRRDHKHDMRVKIVEITEDGQDVVQTFLAHLSE